MEKWELRQAMMFGSKNREHERLMTYMLFAECWGWTPKEVDELDVDIVFKLRHLLMELSKEKERMSRKDKKELQGLM